MAELTSGRVVGNEIFNTLDDPRYNDGNWAKYAAAYIERVPIGSSQNPNRMITRYKVEVHYNRNRITGEIADFKLVNSQQEGCQGYDQPAEAPGGEDIVAGNYTAPQGLGNNWFLAPTWPERFGVGTPGDMTTVRVAPMDTGGGSGCRDPYCGAITLL